MYKSRPTSGEACKIIFCLLRPASGVNQGTFDSTWFQVPVYVHRDRRDYYGRGAQDVHLDFHILLSSELLVSAVRSFISNFVSLNISLLK